jgi:hypothetical protein
MNLAVKLAVVWVLDDGVVLRCDWLSFDIIADFGHKGFGLKDILRTFEPHKWEKLRTAEPQKTFTGPYKKKKCMWASETESSQGFPWCNVQSHGFPQDDVTTSNILITRELLKQADRYIQLTLYPGSSEGIEKAMEIKLKVINLSAE